MAKDPFRSTECFFFPLLPLALTLSIMLGLLSRSRCNQYYEYTDIYGEDSTGEMPCSALFQYTCIGIYDVSTTISTTDGTDGIKYSCGWQTREKVLGAVALSLLVPFVIVVFSVYNKLEKPNCTNRAGLIFFMLFVLLVISTVFLAAGGFMLSETHHVDIEGSVSQGPYKACASLFLVAGANFTLWAITILYNVRDEMRASLAKKFKIFRQRVVIPASSPTPTPLPLT